MGVIKFQSVNQWATMCFASGVRIAICQTSYRRYITMRRGSGTHLAAFAPHSGAYLGRSTLPNLSRGDPAIVCAQVGSRTGLISKVRTSAHCFRPIRGLRARRGRGLGGRGERDRPAAEINHVSAGRSPGAILATKFFKPQRAGSGRQGLISTLVSAPLSFYDLSRPAIPPPPPCQLRGARSKTPVPGTE